MSTHKSSTFGFIIALLAGILLLAVSCVAIQLVVDPRNQYNLINIKDLEARKLPLVISGKDKTNLIKNTNANCIILGTSRAELGINPENIPNYNCINLSTMRSSVEDMRDILRYALQYMDIEMIIWGIDFEMFTNKYGRVKHKYHTEQKKTASSTKLMPNTVLENTPKTMYPTSLLELKNFFSYQDIQKAFKLISGDPIPGSKYHINNGQRKKDKWQRSFDRNGHLAMFQRNDKKFLRANIYLQNKNKQYQQRSHNAFTAFNEVITIIQEHNIEFYAFISPIHIRQLSLIDASNRFDDFQQWKIDLLTSLNTGANFNLYDFSVIDNITIEKVPKSNSHQAMQWYWEAQHYKESLGDVIINHMTTDSGQDFLLNIDNARSFSKRQFDLLSEYKNNHPEVIKSYRKISRRK